MPTAKKATKKPIKKETVQETCCTTTKKNFSNSCKKSSCGGFYFFGFIGAAIYFIGQATTFRIGVLAFLKAIVRPAFLVHGLLKFLGL